MFQHQSGGQQTSHSKENDKSAWCWLENVPKPRGVLHNKKTLVHDWMFEMMANIMVSNTACFLQNIVYICEFLLMEMVKKKKRKFGSVALSSLILIFEIQPFFRLWKTPREMFLCYWPLFNMKHLSAYRPDYANTEYVPRMGDSVNLHNLPSMYFLFGWWIGGQWFFCSYLPNCSSSLFLLRWA